jgi:hypothetical protein
VIAVMDVTVATSSQCIDVHDLLLFVSFPFLNKIIVLISVFLEVDCMAFPLLSG